MILKNIINLFNFSYLLMFLLLIFILNKFFIETNTRLKFFIFVLIFFLFSSLGLYFNLDGIILMFMISELSIILIFITMYSQIYSINVKKEIKNLNFFFFLILILNINYYSIGLLKHSSYYSYFNILINDFYYIYNFFFEKQIIITIITIIIITLYSIFFILLYFNIKNISNNELLKINSILFLRKQNLIHQTNYNTKIRLFQKK